MLKLSTAFCFMALMILMCAAVIRAADTEYDIILKNGTIYDGSGNEPFKGDLAINGDKIVAVGKIENAKGKQEIDVKGLAVAPGFINMLSWATDSLIEDGTSLSDIRQGVTLEVFGEGFSYGPLNESMKKEMEEMQGDIKYKVEWSTLGEYLQFLEKKGISPNVASFVGATTVRVNVVGYDDRPPNPEELDKMRALVKQAMEEGAMGVGSSLIYAPAFYAKTDELIELCKVASPYGGMYISHMRSEANKLLEAVDELIRISREAKIPAEIYHLKAGGVQNWKKMEYVISKVQAAQKEGLKITADMYMYPAGATGLDAAMPPWVQEGGFKKWRERLMDPEIRARVIKEMSTPTDDWENLFLLAGSADKLLLVDFRNEKLKTLT
jgi:N-acyl-D-amino-acid deacylase